ncbi:glycosyl hydrolase family 10-domain-containing protein [Terfezia claveryi]|nr:glycosyl hydrolase family 10-domain-containing protein [Terfezia claveryi]
MKFSALTSPLSPWAVTSVKCTIKGLDRLAKKSGRYVGTATGKCQHWSYSQIQNLDQDAPYAAIAISKEFSQITHENSIKWEVTEPQLGVFNFAPADVLVDWPTPRIHGHTLIWHSQLALWVTANNNTCDAVEGHP